MLLFVNGNKPKGLYSFEVSNFMEKEHSDELKYGLGWKQTGLVENVLKGKPFGSVRMPRKRVTLVSDEIRIKTGLDSMIEIAKSGGNIDDKVYNLLDKAFKAKYFWAPEYQDRLIEAEESLKIQYNEGGSN